MNNFINKKIIGISDTIILKKNGIFKKQNLYMTLIRIVDNVIVNRSICHALHSQSEIKYLYHS